MKYSNMISYQQNYNVIIKKMMNGKNYVEAHKEKKLQKEWQQWLHNANVVEMLKTKEKEMLNDMITITPKHSIYIKMISNQNENQPSGRICL